MALACSTKQIVSIDFGSFGSQATFCLPNNPSTYWICKDWGGMASCPDNSTKKKTLTALLVDKKTEKVKAFGFHAYEMYAAYIGWPNDIRALQTDLTTFKEAKKLKKIQKAIDKKQGDFTKLFCDDDDLVYFEHFKPHLMGKDALMKDKYVQSTDGSTQMSILRLFELSLIEIKKQVMREADRVRKDSKLDAIPTELKEDEILWALSTPSVWDDTARGAFKECAVNAGMNNLVIGLEPEFALFCMTKSDEVDFLTNEDNKKYMILDCGGGTTDATCIETNDGSELAEVTPRDGRELGSLMIDEQYYKMLRTIFGQEVVDAFKIQQPHQWNSLKSNFWKSKHLVDPETFAETGCNVEIPSAFWKHLKQNVKRDDDDDESMDVDDDGKMDDFIDFDQYVAEQCKKYSMSFGSEKHVVYDEDAGNLALSITIWHLLHQDLLDRICDFVRELLDADGMYDCNDVILVGGFSQSAFLRRKLKETFDEITFNSASNACLSVVIGGLLWAYNRDYYSRRMWLTYGFEVEREWHHGNDEINRHSSMNSSTGYVQKHVFDPVVFKNDPFDDGEETKREYVIPFNAGKLKLSVFAVNDEDGADFINEKDDSGKEICKKVAEYELRLKETWINAVQQQAMPVRITFKETMLDIEIQRPDGRWEEMKVKNPKIVE